MIFRRGYHGLIAGGLLVITAIVPGLPPFGQADAAPFPPQSRVGDDRLDEVRGGFILPNGMDLAIGIDIQTLVNGSLALRTELSIDREGGPLVFTGIGHSSGTSADKAGPVNSIPALGVIRVVEGPIAPPEAGVGQQKIEIAPNGPAVSTSLGSVQLTKDDAGSIVVLQGEGLEVRHMIGSVVGSIVANTADNRSIDTIVNVNIDLKNSAVPIGNAMLRWEGIAIEAANRIVR